MTINDIIEMADPESILFDQLDSAITGLDHQGRIVYCYEKMVTAFKDQGMTEEEAIEWIEYNVLPVNAGNGFTVVYEKI